MKILVATVADHAWVENGCLSLCRTFDTINVARFPYKMPRLSIALRLLIRRSEAGQHKLNISLADADGKKLLNADIGMNVQVPPESVPESSFSFALKYPGRYPKFPINTGCPSMACNMSIEIMPVISPSQEHMIPSSISLLYAIHGT